ncbi:MAG: molybdopterin molybdenumtransferase MoeA [Firmicutes bacterium]|nr:molybdopterin molybdenumtransferase MoeA [Bacillota bacterium]
MPEFFKVMSVDEVKEKIREWFGHIKPEGERLPIEDGLDRVLFEDVISPENLPGFDRSAVDGYVLKARDTFGASEAMPAILEVIGEIRIGQVPTMCLGSGQAAVISTGGMLPEGADSVVMVEDTDLLGDKTLNIYKAVSPGENVIRRDEDVKKGETLLRKGHRLRPQDIGALAGIGITRVDVSRKPRVVIISTGDELVEPAAVPRLGQIRDINSYTLSGLVQQYGGEPLRFGIIQDTYNALFEAVEKGIAEGDMVVISGGSSVGTRDVTGRVIEDLGSPGVLAHGVSVKPGKPTIIASACGKPVLGLPGHPVSAMVIFGIFGREIINLKLGYTGGSLKVKAVMGRNIASSAGREDYIRVSLIENHGQLTAIPVLGKSGLISTMVKAHGTVKIPAYKEGIQEGELVDVEIF